MSAHNVTPANRAYLPTSDAARMALCTMTEPTVTRMAHIGALVAWSERYRQIGTHLEVEYTHGPTAYWLVEVLHRSEVTLVDLGPRRGKVRINNAAHVLHRYGFRGGYWTFTPSVAAGLGLARGAVQASGALGRTGLQIGCPSAALMLTLVAVLGRLGIEAEAASGRPRVVISVSETAKALDRLGLGDVVESYQQVRREQAAASQEDLR